MPAPDRNATLEHPEDARAGGQRQAEQRLHAHHPHLWLGLLRARVSERQLLEGARLELLPVRVATTLEPFFHLFCFYDSFFKFSVGFFLHNRPATTLLLRHQKVQVITQPPVSRVAWKYQHSYLFISFIFILCLAAGLDENAVAELFAEVEEMVPCCLASLARAAVIAQLTVVRSVRVSCISLPT
jgi:hypothetical protein